MSGKALSLVNIVFQKWKGQLQMQGPKMSKYGQLMEVHDLRSKSLFAYPLMID